MIFLPWLSQKSTSSKWKRDGKTSQEDKEKKNGQKESTHLYENRRASSPVQLRSDVESSIWKHWKWASEQWVSEWISESEWVSEWVGERVWEEWREQCVRTFDYFEMLPCTTRAPHVSRVAVQLLGFEYSSQSFFLGWAKNQPHPLVGRENFPGRQYWEKWTESVNAPLWKPTRIISSACWGHSAWHLKSERVSEWAAS